MTRRELPREEWSRLADTPELGPIWQTIPPSARVVVVEAEGRIVATWCLLFVAHLEGAWVDPAHPVAAVALLRGVRAVAGDLGLTSVWTGSTTPEVADILSRMGATRVPFESFMLPLMATKEMH